MEEVEPENLRPTHEDGADHQPQDMDEEMAAWAIIPSSTPDRIECCPHAALALAMASTAGATWGTGSHVLPSTEGSTTEPPEEEDRLVDECSSEWSDFGEHPIGPDWGPELIPDPDDEQISDPEDEQSTPPAG